jgi:hypothetical protein
MNKLSIGLRTLSLTGDVKAILAGILVGIFVIGVCRMIAGPNHTDFIGAVLAAALTASRVTRQNSAIASRSVDQPQE